jgi:hypothetical protein
MGASERERESTRAHEWGGDGDTLEGREEAQEQTWCKTVRTCRNKLGCIFMDDAARLSVRLVSVTMPTLFTPSVGRSLIDAITGCVSEASPFFLSPSTVARLYGGASCTSTCLSYSRRSNLHPSGVLPGLGRSMVMDDFSRRITLQSTMQSWQPEKVDPVREA